ncbi:MAG: hypothetical protein K9L32_00650 [Chromatiaceae bacterium]|nr:hypothetical protein [Chromatiaceae bacterium]MCF8002714.1 hypothetical protein [Chromatiaceae bacterium]
MNAVPNAPSPSAQKPRPLLPDKAREVCLLLGLDVDASPLLREGMTADQFLTALVEQGQLRDAVTFMACALPKREALWWAYLCAREATTPPLCETDAAALDAAIRWISDPSEEHRQAAMPAAEATEYETPAGLVALGTFFSGGSIAPPDLSPVPTAPELTAHSVSGAVMLAAVMEQPEKADATYRRFLKTALDVARHKLRWDQDPASDQ